MLLTMVLQPFLFFLFLLLFNIQFMFCQIIQGKVKYHANNEQLIVTPTFSALSSSSTTLAPIVLFVDEGEEVVIKKSLLNVIRGTNNPSSSSNIWYNVTRFPIHGQLMLDHLIILPNSTTTTISGRDVDKNRFQYKHDDSESENDSFEFVSSDSKSKLKFKGRIDVRVKLKNDQSPIRVIDKVFHVVRNGEKSLTSKDLKYSDPDINCNPTDIKYNRRAISNGAIYDKLSGKELFEFTQQDLDLSRLKFKHWGNDSSQTVFWVTDGHFYDTGILRIEASDPFVTISKSSGIIVKLNQPAQITSLNLSIETNVEVEDEDVRFEILSVPSFGTIRKRGKGVGGEGEMVNTFFTLSDLEEGIIEYRGNPGINDPRIDPIKLRASLAGGNIIKLRSQEGELLVKLYPSRFWDPLFIERNETLFVDEGNSAIITGEDLLRITHSSIPPANITYLITLPPQFGIITEIAPGQQDSSLPSVNESILFFTQKDLNEKRIRYLHLSNHKNRTSRDSFRFDVTNSVITTQDLLFHIHIISQTILISARNLTVQEGSRITFPKDMFSFSTPFYQNQIDEYLIIGIPEHGSISLLEKSNSTLSYPSSTFTPLDLEKGLLVYTHDSSESLHDWVTIVARVSKIGKESVPVTVHIQVEPVNDEKPRIVNNTGLSVWEWNSQLLTVSHLAASDLDSSPSEIRFMISPSSNGGFFSYKEYPSVAIDKFTQEDINLKRILFKHSGPLVGQMRFQVTDGRNILPVTDFVITAKPVMIQLLVNQSLQVFPPQMQQSITRDHLLASTNDDNNSREITYKVMRGPRMGRILLEHLDGSTSPVQSFSQKEVNNKAVLFEQTKTLTELSTRDSIELEIESPFVRSLKQVTFIIDISVGATGKEVIQRELDEKVLFNSISVLEGGKVALDDEIVNATQLKRNWDEHKMGLLSTSLSLRITGMPSHGWLELNNERVMMTGLKIPFLDSISHGSLAYHHDHSNTFNDSIDFALHLENGFDIHLMNRTLFIEVIPVQDEEVELLTHRSVLAVIQGEESILNSSFLNSRDADGVTQDIIYSIISGSENGFLALTSDPRTPINNFSQSDIDTSRVLFKHDFIQGIKPGIIHFKVTDGNSNPIYSSFTIHVQPIQLITSNNSQVAIKQGNTIAEITSEILTVETNVKIRKNDLVYRMTERPGHGKVLLRGRELKDEELFSQSDVELSYISYLQTDLTSSSDYFILDLFKRSSDDDLFSQSNSISVRDIKIHITVEADIPNLNLPVHVALGQMIIISLGHLDASQLATKTKSTPVFFVSRKPKLGYLKRFPVTSQSGFANMNSSPNGRAIPSDFPSLYPDELEDYEVTEFTHEDIKMGLIGYFVRSDLSLQGVRFEKEEDSIQDIVELIVSADNVQPGKHKLTFMITNVSTISTTPFLIFKHEGNLTTLYSPPPSSSHPRDLLHEVRYLNIQITKDHLIIFGIIVLVVLATLFLIILMRLLQLFKDVEKEGEVKNKEQVSSSQSLSASPCPSPPPAPVHNPPSSSLLPSSSRETNYPIRSTASFKTIPSPSPRLSTYSSNNSPQLTISGKETPSEGISAPPTSPVHQMGSSFLARDTFGRPKTVDKFPYTEEAGQRTTIYPLPPPILYFSDGEGGKGETGGREARGIDLSTEWTSQDHNHHQQPSARVSFQPCTVFPTNINSGMVGDGMSISRNLFWTECQSFYPDIDRSIEEVNRAQSDNSPFRTTNGKHIVSGKEGSSSSSSPSREMFLHIPRTDQVLNSFSGTSNPSQQSHIILGSSQDNTFSRNQEQQQQYQQQFQMRKDQNDHSRLASAGHSQHWV